LGISDATAKDLHVACLNEEVRALLGKISDNNDSEDEDSSSPAEPMATKFVDGTMTRVRNMPLLRYSRCSCAIFS
jgi:hypothetical protein